jgi:hypothetical protein
VDPVTIRDSAGVRIVESAAPAWSGERAWRVTPEPLLQIGAVDGDEPYVLTRVSHGALHPDGSFALLDGTTMEIRLFDPAGRHRTTFGGVGAGPGEFLQDEALPYVSILAFSHPDTLVAWDAAQYRLTWFTLDGTVRRTLSLDPNLPGLAHRRSPLDLWQVLPGGDLLRLRYPLDPPTVSVGQRAVQLVRTEQPAIVPVAELAGEPSVTVRYTSSRGTPVNMTMANRLFGGEQLAVAGGSPLRVFVPDAERWELRVYGAQGRLEEVLRPALSRIAVQRDWIEQAVVMGSSSPEVQDARRRLPVSDSLPAINGFDMHWDEAGYLWVGHYARSNVAGGTDRRYEVFAADGRWMGGVAFPPVYRVLDVSRGRALTVHRDDLGVEYVRVYRVEGAPTAAPPATSP